MNDRAEGGAAPGDAGPSVQDTYSSILALRNARWLACFGYRPSDYRQQTGATYFFDGDIGILTGRKTVDAARVTTCITHYQTASCDELAQAFVIDQDPCSGWLVGQVPPGGACDDMIEDFFAPEQCSDPAHYTCIRAADPGACPPGRCARLRTLAEPCDDNAPPCAPTLSCQENVCVKAISGDPGEGKPCSGPCDGDLFCAFGGPDVTTGTCRRRAAGTRCDGNWQCGEPYVCVPGDGGGQGVCWVGRSPSSSCPNDAPEMVGDDGSVVCPHGQPAGAACVASGDCFPGLVCAVPPPHPVCLDRAALVPLGGPCVEQSHCAAGTYCAVMRGTYVVGGTCDPIPRAGEACVWRGGPCVAPAMCVGDEVQMGLPSRFVCKVCPP